MYAMYTLSHIRLYLSIFNDMEYGIQAGIAQGSHQAKLETAKALNNLAIP